MKRGRERYPRARAMVGGNIRVTGLQGWASSGRAGAAGEEGAAQRGAMVSTQALCLNLLVLSYHNLLHVRARLCMVVDWNYRKGRSIVVLSQWTDTPRRHNGCRGCINCWECLATSTSLTAVMNDPMCFGEQMIDRGISSFPATASSIAE